MKFNKTEKKSKKKKLNKRRWRAGYMAWNVGLRSNSAWILSKYMLTAKFITFFFLFPIIST